MNRRSRNNSGFQNRDIAPLRELQKLIGGTPTDIKRKLSKLGMSIEDLAFEDGGRDLFTDAVDESLPLGEQWGDWFDNLYYAAPDEFVEVDLSDFRCEVTEMYAHGEFHGICKVGSQTHYVFARVGLEEIPAACDCEVSRGKNACPHAVEFVRTLSEELLTSKSVLRKRVNAERFQKGKPDYARYQPDASQEALADLDRLMSFYDVDDSDANAEDDTIFVRQSKASDRLAWRLESSKHAVTMYPVQQMPAKKGNGYTKGRRQKLESVLRNRGLSTTPQDDLALTHVIFEESYYRYEPEAVLDVFSAMRCLVGASNVFLDATQLEIRSDSFEFEVVEVGGKYSLIALLSSDLEPLKKWARETALESISKGAIGGDQLHGIEYHFGHEGLVMRLDKSFSRVSVVECSEADQPILKKLLYFDGVSVEHGEALFERLRKLQSRWTIRLPEQTVGQVIQSRSRPVVLLRSNSDGSIDVVLRVRDRQDKLRRVGGQPAITHGELDGKPVQFERDVAAEVQRAELLSRELRMNPAEAFEGETYSRHITDFGEALTLIDQLQSQAEHSDAPEMLWDRNSEKPVSVLGHVSSHNVRVEINKKRDWFGISGHCEINGKKIGLAELLDQFGDEDVDRVHGDFVRLQDGQWASISEKLRKRLRGLRDATHQDRKTLKLDATSAPMIRDVFADGEIELKAVKSWQQCLTKLAKAEKLQPKVPRNLDAELREYQVEGFAWLRRLAEWGVGGVLADDMGLGKTLQTLAVLLDRKKSGPALVIAPTSVGFNWVREAERFTPDLTVHLYRETDRKEFLETVKPGDLVVCSYGLALRDAEALSAVDWGSLVLDEAQAVKNSRSKTSIAIAGIPAQWKVALTGTPMENHLGELWSLFHVVSPGVLGGWEAFRKRYALPIEKKNSESARHRLSERLKPFILRRKKSEVLTELPPRTEMNLYVDLSAEERVRYEKVRLEAIGEADEIQSTVTTQDQRFRILALLTRLRQISCHVKLVDKTYEGTSAKLQCLIETLADLKEEGHRALIFSQFTEHLALIRAAIEEAGFTHEYLDGSTPAKSRQERVDAFQNGTSDVFLISLKAGGTGLNLTAADYVIHMDPWWNPAVEDQATDRAHRIGQENPVMVYRIVAKGTIEEEILALHESKRDLVAGVMEGTAAAGKLSNDELIAMLRKD